MLRPLAECSADSSSPHALLPQVTLVVNVASKCGYTATNYEHLQPLYERYRDRGFAVLAFPCDCFGNQEPDSDAEIAAFARDTYGVTFPMFAKVPDVNGDSAAPVCVGCSALRAAARMC